jgi:hypothetical protein
MVIAIIICCPSQAVLHLLCDKSGSGASASAVSSSSAVGQHAADQEHGLRDLGLGSASAGGVGSPRYVGFVNGSEHFEWRSEYACPLCQREYLVQWHY